MVVVGGVVGRAGGLTFGPSSPVSTRIAAPKTPKATAVPTLSPPAAPAPLSSSFSSSARTTGELIIANPIPSAPISFLVPFILIPLFVCPYPSGNDEQIVIAVPFFWLSGRGCLNTNHPSAHRTFIASDTSHADIYLEPFSNSIWNQPKRNRHIETRGSPTAVPFIAIESRRSAFDPTSCRN